MCVRAYVHHYQTTKKINCTEVKPKLIFSTKNIFQIDLILGYGKGDGYFQYINVPAHKKFEWGYRRGNPDHNR